MEPVWPARGRSVAPSLAAGDEQSGNVGTGHQTLAIRAASASSASASARQTSSVGALPRLPAGTDVFLAATAAAAGLRMFTIYATRAGRNDKGPGIARAFDARPEQSLTSARC